MMGLLKTQRVYDQCVNTLEIRNFLIGDGFHIRYISEAAKAETKDRELVVHHLNRLYLNVAYPEYVMLIYCVYVQLWDTKVQVFSKAIWHRSVESVNSTLIGIDINITKLAKRTQVVESSHMIVVDMGKQDTINLTEWLAKNLLPKVRPTVDEHTCGRSLKQGGGPQAAVPRVFTPANGAVATYKRNTLRRAGTQKG